MCIRDSNGADAVAAARMLKEKGHPAAVILVGDRERGTEELKLQLSIAERLGVTVEQFGDFIPGGCEVLIDGVFGAVSYKHLSDLYRKLPEPGKGKKERGLYGKSGNLL